MPQKTVDSTRQLAEPMLKVEHLSNRRQFLKIGVAVSAAAGGGLLLGFSVSGRTEERRVAAAGSGALAANRVEQEPLAAGFAPNAFVRIDRSGLVEWAVTLNRHGDWDVRALIRIAC